MKKLLLFLMFAIPGLQLKAQQQPDLLPVDSLLNRALHQLSKNPSVQSTFTAPFKQKMPVLAANNFVIQQNAVAENMPIAVLSGKDDMPVIKLDGFDHMAILTQGASRPVELYKKPAAGLPTYFKPGGQN